MGLGGLRQGSLEGESRKPIQRQDPAIRCLTPGMSKSPRMKDQGEGWKGSGVSEVPMNRFRSNSSVYTVRNLE